tara:strand:- start:349 stop:720 length:372 start_codon:yes stop_codon:yes gene_type:complete
MTSLLMGAMVPHQAVPQLVVFKERTPLQELDPKVIARELLTKKDFRCFSEIMTRESHWKDAKNPTSTASGVGQLLDSTYKNLGMKRSKSEIAQTVAALAYIGRKFGSGGPCKAWAFWEINKNY